MATVAGDPFDEMTWRFLYEVFRTASYLEDVARDTLEILPPGVFREESNEDALMRMIVGTVNPAVAAAGDEACAAATALVSAARDRVESAVEEVIEMAERRRGD
jgi:hypothetical protein